MLVNDKQIINFQDILNALKDLTPGQQHIISGVLTVCRILLVSPATSATGERMFSMARRVKTWFEIQYAAAEIQQHCSPALSKRLDRQDTATWCRKRICWEEPEQKKELWNIYKRGLINPSVKELKALYMLYCRTSVKQELIGVGVHLLQAVCLNGLLKFRLLTAIRLIVLMMKYDSLFYSLWFVLYFSHQYVHVFIHLYIS